MSDDILEESEVYDNFINADTGEIEEIIQNENDDTLNDMFGVKVVENEPEWKSHWKGMPEFNQKNNPPYKKIIVSFRTKEDYEEFAKIIDQGLTDKTKSIWHPKLAKTKNSLMRWISEED